MATFKRFEDIEAWKKAREISKEVYRLSGQGIFSKDFELKNQAGASAGSMMDNIAEGFDRGGKLEFIQFLTVAKGSSAELKSQLYRANDNNFISEKEFDGLYAEIDSYSKMVSGLISYLNQTSIKGEKFKNRMN